jgi:DNA-binding SARP family transcriptional activator
LLRQPRLQGPDGRVIDLIAKDAALLAVLACEGSCPRARLAAWAWPDATPAQARANLRQRLFRLGRLAGRPLVTAGEVMRLVPDVQHVLDEALEALRHDPQACAGTLLGIHEFTNEPALDEWLQSARAQWAARCAQVLRQLCSEHQQAGRHARAIVYAERLVRELPLHEEAHRLLMDLHEAHGDRSAALAVYHRLAQRLRLDLGVEPSTDTEALLRHITADRPAGPAHPASSMRPQITRSARQPARHPAAFPAGY